MTPKRNITPGRMVLGAIMVTMGTLHLTHGEVFASIVPDYLPAHLFLAYLSGAFEIALGVALLFERTRVLAAWGLFALFIAVFPANIHMALHPELPIAGVDPSFRPPPVALWLRLPLQLALLYWAFLYTRKRGSSDGAQADARPRPVTQ